MSHAWVFKMSCVQTPDRALKGANFAPRIRSQPLLVASFYYLCKIPCSTYTAPTALVAMIFLVSKFNSVCSLD